MRAKSLAFGSCSRAFLNSRNIPACLDQDLFGFWKIGGASVGRDDNRPTNSALTFKELSLKIGILKSLRIFLIKCFHFLQLCDQAL
jgi:hypothetical protein